MQLAANMCMLPLIHGYIFQSRPKAFFTKDLCKLPLHVLLLDVP